MDIYNPKKIHTLSFSCGGFPIYMCDEQHEKITHWITERSHPDIQNSAVSFLVSRENSKKN